MSSSYSRGLFLLRPWENTNALQYNTIVQVRGDEVASQLLFIVVLLCANGRWADLFHLSQFPLVFPFNSSPSLTSLDKTTDAA